MHTHTRLLRLATSLFIIHFTLFISAARAQRVSQPDIDSGQSAAPIPVETTIATTGDDEEDIVELSVFTVSGEKDVGYTAMNSSSGSRVSTPLKDLAASISVLTPEFLDDIAATTIEDVMLYSGNMQGEFEDTATGFNDLNARGAGGGDAKYRKRGFKQDRYVDYAYTETPVNLYNVDRYEVMSGPNSILFGLGNPGGITNITTKRANAQRNKFTTKFAVRTWDSPTVAATLDNVPALSTNLDYNLVLMPKIMGIRVMGVYEEGSGQSWRRWANALDRRITTALFLRPFKNTNINIKYETGRFINSRVFNNTSPADRIAQWLYNGSPTTASFPAENNDDSDGHYTLNSGGGNPRYTFVVQDNAVFDLRQTVRSTPYDATYSSPEVASIANDILRSAAYYNLAGPGAIRDAKFDSASINIEQTIGKLNIELAYTHNKYKGIVHNTLAYHPSLTGDASEYISSNYEQVPRTSGNVMANTRAGQWYFEDQWIVQGQTNKNDVLRLTAEYNLDLKKFGTHRIIGYYEYSKQENTSTLRPEVLVNENQRMPIAGDDVSNENNWLKRRQYVDPNDYNTWYVSDWRTPMPEIIFGGQRWRSAYAVRDLGHVEKTNNAFMFALQSYFFNRRLSTLLGIRYDNLALKQAITSQITDPNDPRILNKTNILGDRAFTGAYRENPKNSPVNYTAGAVYHITQRYSVFANYGTNTSEDRTGGSYLPNGGPPPISEGRGLDYGVRLDPFGNGKLVLRVARFETDQKHGPGITNNANKVGGLNLPEIYNALYVGAGFSPEDLASRGVKNISYSYAMSDITAKGFEAELSANITKNFTLRGVFAYTQTEKTTIGKEILDYYNANIPVWFGLVKQYREAHGGDDTVTFKPTNRNINFTGSLGDFIFQHLFMPGIPNDGTHPGPNVGGLLYSSYGAAGDNNTSVKQGLLGVYEEQLGDMTANRPYAFNIQAKYTFPNKSPLKGWATQLDFIYQSANNMIDPNYTRFTYEEPKYDPENPPTSLDINTGDYAGGRDMRKGNSLIFWNAMLRYKFKILGGRASMSLQLNVRNIFNQSVVSVARTDVNNVPDRFYYYAPRSFRLSASVDF